MTDSTRNLLARAHGQWRADRFQPETSAQVYPDSTRTACSRCRPT